MDRRERERILGEWGVRDDTVRGRAIRSALEEDVATSPLAGRPLRSRHRNWRPEADSYISALGGPLPYMLRLREIEALSASGQEGQGADSHSRTRRPFNASAI